MMLLAILAALVSCGIVVIDAKASCGVPAISHVFGNGGFRVVGGTEAKPGSWPWMAALRVSWFHGGTEVFCGGSLIHPRWILSAAHCFDPYGTRNTKQYKIALGKHTSFSSEPSEQIIDIKKIYVHERYTSPINGHDVALIKLKKRATLNDRVSLLCLPTRKSKPNEMCYVTGWGITKGTSTHGNLKQAYVPIVDAKSCRSRTYMGSVIRSNVMVCAGYEQGAHDACKHDSGGPLVCKNNGRYEVFGAVSFGSDCALARKPGVYARVNPYVKWINDKINNN